MKIEGVHADWEKERVFYWLFNEGGILWEA